MDHSSVIVGEAAADVKSNSCYRAQLTDKCPWIFVEKGEEFLDTKIHLKTCFKSIIMGTSEKGKRVKKHVN
jgi:hypothetical protein